jgi:hypothetical protein
LLVVLTQIRRALRTFGQRLFRQRQHLVERKDERVFADHDGYIRWGTAGLLRLEVSSCLGQLFSYGGVNLVH